jgi:hypothetical protein
MNLILNEARTDPFTPPAGESECDFIQKLLGAYSSYQNNLPYSIPSHSGYMAPGHYNSDSFVAGLLTAAGLTPPPINTGGAFQVPGYLNPIPLPKQ